MALFDDALAFASRVHRGQTRKRERLPYILHPMEAAAIAATVTDDEEVLAAALLHDVIEDAGVTERELCDAFGARVASLVKSETEDEGDPSAKAQTWRYRKEESLARLAKVTDEGAKIVWLADKLSNMRSFCRQHAAEGDAMWEHYHEKDPAVQAWYYRAVARLTSSLAHTAAYEEYIQRTNCVFGKEE